jgi:alkylation response protein AidB-like acyl-CoA dehydrogenase
MYHAAVMSWADQGTKLGLRALNRFAGLEVVDRLGLREPTERLLYRASSDSVRIAGRAGRTFKAVRKLGRPARLERTRPADVFDLTPDDEQQMLRESFRSFAADRLRPVAQEADAACAPPDGLLAQCAELGITMLGVPEEAGGAVAERSTVTAVLAGEALAHGDMGLAVAALSPAAVSTALGLWGNAEQQATYLPELVGDDVPAASLALLEPTPLFDPMHLRTRAERVDGGFRLDGVKSLVPLAQAAELFVVGAALDGTPALFIVESKTPGIFTEPEPAMGIRGAATGRLILDAVKLPDRALLGGADPDAYRECVERGRLGWCTLAVGTAQAVVDYVIPYVNERVAFGEPISHRQAVAFTVADAAIELEGMRLLTYRAAARADQGKPFARETALARRLCGERGMAIGSDGVQLLGGHGFVKEHPVERWYRDLRAAALMEGAVLV